MENKKFKDRPLTRFLRAAIEIGFIVFLFYSNLLMGEFTRTAKEKTLFGAIADIFTTTNFIIAIAAAITGHFVFQFLRKKFKNEGP